MKMDPIFPKPPLSEEVEIVNVEEIEAKNPQKRRVRYTLESITKTPSPGIVCSCKGSQNLGQHFSKSGKDAERTINGGTEDIWEIELVIEPQRWKCSRCKAHRFNHEYKFIEKRSTYTNHCKAKFVGTAERSNASEAARLHGIPPRTGYTLFHVNHLPKEGN